jgi:hypothetical protein
MSRECGTVAKESLTHSYHRLWDAAIARSQLLPIKSTSDIRPWPKEAHRRGDIKVTTAKDTFSFPMDSSPRVARGAISIIEERVAHQAAIRIANAKNCGILSKPAC